MSNNKTGRTSPIESMADALSSVRSQAHAVHSDVCTQPNGSHTSADPIKGLSKRGQQLVAAKTFGVYSRARVSGEAN